MSFVDTCRANGTLTVAAPGLLCMGNTPYSGRSFQCEGDSGRAKVAVHTWEGRHYCAYHSPFDMEDVVEESAPQSVLCPDVVTGCSHDFIMGDEGVVACMGYTGPAYVFLPPLPHACKHCGSHRVHRYSVTPPPSPKGAVPTIQHGSLCRRCRMYTPSI